ncbi:MAG: hypothetical protein IH585_12010 [Anaerolineaceae bacterium]|nr:hypothetical protein [Anaerolineaceae bacterium]
MKKIVFTFVIFCTIVGFTGISPVQAEEFSCGDVKEIPQSECEALVDLYNSTNGDNWARKDNWLITNSPSEWFGIFIIDNHVNMIVLSNNSLSGNIPPTLENFLNLEFLDLMFNQLTGSIPPELGKLVKLTGLLIESNQLTGSIPSELGKLDNLRYLLLARNFLIGSIPPQLGNLSNLERLHLFENPLLSGSIPMKFSKLEKLMVFTFYGKSICEPTNPKYITWKESVDLWIGTDIDCLNGKK